MNRASTVLISLAIAACMPVAAPVLAQPVSTEDCKVPGGCGSSGKPGGVERAPGPAEVMERAPSTTKRKRAAAPKAARPRPVDGAKTTPAPNAGPRAK